MKKACISTYCEWTSYGSIMQSIGLKQALLTLGVESFIVRDQPALLAQKHFPFLIGKNPKQMILNMVKNIRREHRRRLYEGTVAFMNEHVDVLYYNDYKTVEKMPPEADYYIAGSDQIWNPDLCNPLFFLDFLPESVKRLSYAASMGKTRIASENEEKFYAMAKKFASVSVREQEVAAVLKENLSQPIQVNIDPTFLQSTESWRGLSRPYPIKKPYILVYAIYWDKQLNKKLKRLHKETGYDVVALGTGFPAVWSNHWVDDADPGQFLWLVDNAQAVVTSSFHGVAFSLIFSKKLAAVINPVAKSRIQNILSTVQYTNVEVDKVMDVDLTCYGQVKSNIAKEKEKSMGYLKEMLGI